MEIRFMKMTNLVPEDIRDRPLLAELHVQLLPFSRDINDTYVPEESLKRLEDLLAEGDRAERIRLAEEMFRQLRKPEDRVAVTIVARLCLMAHVPESATEIPELTIGSNHFKTVRTGELGQMRPRPDLLLEEEGVSCLTFLGGPLEDAFGPDDAQRIREAARMTAAVVADRIPPIRQGLGEEIFPMRVRGLLDGDLDSGTRPQDIGEMADRLGRCEAVDTVLLEARHDLGLRRVLTAHALAATEWIGIAQAAGDGETLLEICREAEIPALPVGARLNAYLGPLRDDVVALHADDDARLEWKTELEETTARVVSRREADGLTP